jgi:hypothetical protein
MKNIILIIALAVCVTATPAMADLFNFTFGSLSSTGSSTKFTATVVNGVTQGDVTRVVAPLGSAAFNDTWGVTPENFIIDMNLTDVTATTAKGNGDFTITDVDSDTITGDIVGDWSLPVFVGTISNVAYTPSVAGENTFNGDSGSALMDFGGGFGGWEGVLIELTTFTGLSFSSGWTSDTGPGATATVVVPVPAAFILGILSLGSMGLGLKLRKLA